MWLNTCSCKNFWRVWHVQKDNICFSKKLTRCSPTWRAWSRSATSYFCPVNIYKPIWLFVNIFPFPSSVHWQLLFSSFPNPSLLEHLLPTPTDCIYCVRTSGDISSRVLGFVVPDYRRLRLLFLSGLCYTGAVTTGTHLLSHKIACCVCGWLWESVPSSPWQNTLSELGIHRVEVKIAGAPASSFSHITVQL